MTTEILSQGAQKKVAGTNPSNLLFKRALRDVPKLLTLQDRNPYSQSYGCFDRNYWHYKIVDFPSGMAQEFVLPLALAWKLDRPDNSFRGVPALREWVRAGIAYADSSSHADGSCDDYYPFEKAAGAAAFSLYAALRAIEICGLDPAAFKPFLVRRGTWLGEHEESGHLSNHEALIANVLLRLGAVTGEQVFARHARRRLERLLEWRSEEGWFREYDGVDPGYLTLTIAMLVEIDTIEPGLKLRPAIAGAVRFLHAIQPPDGWLGGEWSSRNTHNYFPHGLEVCGNWLPEALELNSRAIGALERAAEYADDHIVGHHCWSYFLASECWHEKRGAVLGTRGDFRRVFEKAGIVLERRGRLTLLAATKKGGAFRAYCDDKLICADTGVSLQVGGRGLPRTAVCHLSCEDNAVSLSPDSIEIKGRMGWAKSQRMTPAKLIVLRLMMLTVGRFWPDRVRRMLQALLITGRSRAPFSYIRHFHWDDSQLTVEDEVSGKDFSDVLAAGIGPAQTSIYAVMSRVYHPSQLQPWLDLSDRIPRVSGDTLTLRRTFPA